MSYTQGLLPPLYEKYLELKRSLTVEALTIDFLSGQSCNNLEVGGAIVCICNTSTIWTYEAKAVCKSMISGFYQDYEFIFRSFEAAKEFHKTYKNELKELLELKNMLLLKGKLKLVWL